MAIFHDVILDNTTNVIAPPTVVQDNWTTCIWAFPTSFAGLESVFISIGDGDANGWAIEIESNNWKYLVNAVVRNNTGNAATVDAWQHVCVKRASGTASFYRDGAQTGSTWTNTPNTPTLGASLGCQVDSAIPTIIRGIIGHYCEAAVWEAALSDAEIHALGADAVSPLLIRPDTLKAYWPCHDRATKTVDVVGGCHMTWGGAPGEPAWSQHPRMIYPSKRARRILVQDAQIIKNVGSGLGPFFVRT